MQLTFFSYQTEILLQSKSYEWTIKVLELCNIYFLKIRKNRKKYLLIMINLPIESFKILPKIKNPLKC